MDELTEFHREFLAEIQGDADAQGLITTEAFLEKMGEILDESGELSSFAQCYHEGTFQRKAVQIDAYGWDPEDEDGVLSLVVADFSRSEEPEAIGKAEVVRSLSRLNQFVMAALDREYRDGLEETSQPYVLADLIKRCWKKISKIKLIVVTNKINKSKTDAQPVGTIGEIPVTSNVWDLGRIQRFVEAGQTREELVIDFAEDFGEPIPILKASYDGSPLESYIAVIPGAQLAAIYDRWGARLLEANVRSFLQARGKVNRGIRDTISKDPSMFFSYNNGLTTTAESVEVADLGEGLLLMSAANFQIVNGGQTTASIHAARKQIEQLKDVFVQMKLTVVPPESSEVVVPNISQFANSQNKVNAADFFANHPFHIRMEEFSRRILAPIGDSNYREHKWFYERARGQFADERGRRTESERKSFDAMFPKSQFFTKTDLAKYENSFRCRPHDVSHGAQKNFAQLAKAVGEEWTKSEGGKFDEIWFQRLIAKAIIFRTLERLVPAQTWYTGGYRANIVTYAIAKVVHDAEERDRIVDLDAVWRMQRVHVELERALLAAAEAANDVIVNPPSGIRNMSEWAKKQACWAELSRQEVHYESGFDSVLIDPEAAKAVRREKRKEAQETNGIEAQRTVVEQGGEYWSQWLAYGKSAGQLDAREAGILEVCARLPGRIPTERQSIAALDIADKLSNFYQASGK